MTDWTAGYVADIGYTFVSGWPWHLDAGARNMRGR